MAARTDGKERRVRMMMGTSERIVLVSQLVSFVLCFQAPYKGISRMGACTSSLSSASFVMPSKATPPGLPLVLPYVPLLVLPLLIVYLSSFFVSLSSWTFVLLSILSFPTCIAGQITVKGFNDQRVASSLGASLPPTWNGAWFGNVDILLHLLEASKRGYLGTYRTFFFAAPRSDVL